MVWGAGQVSKGSSITSPMETISRYSLEGLSTHTSIILKNRKEVYGGRDPVTMDSVCDHVLVHSMPRKPLMERNNCTRRCRSIVWVNDGDPFSAPPAHTALS